MELNFNFVWTAYLVNECIVADIPYIYDDFGLLSYYSRFTVVLC